MSVVTETTEVVQAYCGMCASTGNWQSRATAVVALDMLFVDTEKVKSDCANCFASDRQIDPKPIAVFLSTRT